MILKTQQRFKHWRHNIFNEDINGSSLSSNDDKRIQSIDSIATCAYKTSKNQVNEKEDAKCSNIIKQLKMINFDDVTKENIIEHNPKSESRKTNSLFNLISPHSNIDKSYFYAKDLYKAKY